jgi:hypothetical protein
VLRIRNSLLCSLFQNKPHPFNGVEIRALSRVRDSMDLVVISQVCSNVVLCFGTMWRISISLQNPNSVIQGVVKPCELYHVDVFREEVLSVVFRVMRWPADSPSIGGGRVASHSFTSAAYSSCV